MTPFGVLFAKYLDNAFSLSTGVLVMIASLIKTSNCFLKFVYFPRWTELNKILIFSFLLSLPSENLYFFTTIQFLFKLIKRFLVNYI